MRRVAPDGGTAAVGGAVFDDGSAVCPGCDEQFDGASVEYFELTGDMRCEECVEAYFDDLADDDGQLDEAQEWADFDPEC